MYLYEQKNYIINIYSFNEKKEAIVSFREKIIREKGITFYKLTTSEERIKNRFLKEQEINIDELQNCPENSKDIASNQTILEQEISSAIQKEELHEQIIQDYIEGVYSKNLPTRIYTTHQDDIIFTNNLLSTTEPIKTIKKEKGKKTIYTLKNIMDIPEELYALQLLQTGSFKQLVYSGINYDKLLELFIIEKLTSIPLSATQLKEMYDFKLLDGNYFNELSKIDSTTKVLSRRKK